MTAETETDPTTKNPGADAPAGDPADSADDFDEEAYAARWGTPLSRARRRDRDALVLSAVVVILSLLLGVTGGGEKVAPLGREGMNLPGVCPSRGLFGFECPGCGLTRSFIATAHGHLVDAFGFHRLGPILFVIVALQVPIRAAAIVRRRRLGEEGAAERADAAERRGGGWATPIGLLIGVALIGNWVVGHIVSLFTSGTT